MRRRLITKRRGKEQFMIVRILLWGKRRELLFLIMKRERGEKIQKGEYRTVKHEGVLDGSCDAESCVRGT